MKKVNLNIFIRRSLVLITLLFLSQYLFAEVTRNIIEKYPEGNTKQIEYYKDEKIIAKESFDQNGNIIAKEGLIPDGKIKQYYESGNLYGWWTCKNNKRNGKSKIYYQNGKLRGISYFKDDELVGKSKDYWENGNLKSIQKYKNGKVDGIFKQYNEDGELRFEGQYKDGNFDGIIWNRIVHTGFEYNDGVLIRKYYFNKKWELVRLDPIIDNKVKGIQKSYYENGNLRVEGIVDEGIKDGKFYEYYNNGNIKRELIYKNNELMKFRVINEAGNLFMTYNNAGNLLIVNKDLGSTKKHNIQKIKKVSIYNNNVIANVLNQENKHNLIIFDETGDILHTLKNIKFITDQNFYIEPIISRDTRYLILVRHNQLDLYDIMSGELIGRKEVFKLKSKHIRYINKIKFREENKSVSVITYGKYNKKCKEYTVTIEQLKKEHVRMIDKRKKRRVSMAKTTENYIKMINEIKQRYENIIKTIITQIKKEPQQKEDLRKIKKLYKNLKREDDIDEINKLVNKINDLEFKYRVKDNHSSY